MVRSRNKIGYVVTFFIAVFCGHQIGNVMKTAIEPAHVINAYTQSIDEMTEIETEFNLSYACIEDL